MIATGEIKFSWMSQCSVSEDAMLQTRNKRSLFWDAMESLRSTKMSVNISQATRRQIPEDNPLHNHCRDSPKSNKKSYVEFKAATAVVMKITIFCNVTPWSPFEVN
jgi:hypothetical protein